MIWKKLLAYRARALLLCDVALRASLAFWRPPSFPFWQQPCRIVEKFAALVFWLVPPSSTCAIFKNSKNGFSHHFTRAGAYEVAVGCLICLGFIPGEAPAGSAILLDLNHHAVSGNDTPGSGESATATVAHFQAAGVEGLSGSDTVINIKAPNASFPSQIDDSANSGLIFDFTSQTYSTSFALQGTHFGPIGNDLLDDFIDISNSTAGPGPTNVVISGLDAYLAPNKEYNFYIVVADADLTFDDGGGPVEKTTGGTSVGDQDAGTAFYTFTTPEVLDANYDVQFNWARAVGPPKANNSSLRGMAFVDTDPPFPDLDVVWKNDGSGEWTCCVVPNQSETNWSATHNLFAEVPNSNLHTATFGDVITAGRTVVVDTDVTINQIVFDNTQTYNIAGVASVSLESNTLPSLALVTVMQGNHQFQVTTNLLSDSTVDVAAESTLSFHNMLNLMGHTLVKTGAGTMYINNVLHTGDGTIDVQQGTVSGVGTLGGDVINDSGIISPGHGERITVVPEPMGVVLIVMGLLVLSFQSWCRE